MDVQKILDELYAERARIEHAIVGAGIVARWREASAGASAEVVAAARARLGDGVMGADRADGGPRIG